MFKLTRRRLIETGIAGAALMALVNCARSKEPAKAAFDDPNYRYHALNEGDRAMFAAVAGVLLAGALPDGNGARAALVWTVRGVDLAVSGLSPDVAGELRELFGLLAFPMTRAFAAGIWTSWTDATPRDVTAFLTRWRFSNLALFRSGYQALHQLVMAAWYGNSASWARIGYPGPPAVS